MKRLGKSTKKGFTLVELIVVLVILAVLAAMLVPALVGYIDKAKKEKEYQTAATVYAAAQAVITEKYGKDEISAAGTLSKATSDDPVIALAGLDPASVDAYAFAYGSDFVIGSSTSTAPATTGLTGFKAPTAGTGETLAGYVQIGDACYFLFMKSGTPRWEGVLKSAGTT